MVRILIILLFVPIALFCQVDSLNNNSDIEIVFTLESWPEYEGNLMDFVKSQINYPKSAIQDSIEGIVYISLWVDENGNTSDHKIVKGIRNDINEEALRVARLIKFAKPAYQRGKPIRVNYIVRIEFKIEDSKMILKRKKR